MGSDMCMFSSRAAAAFLLAWSLGASAQPDDASVAAARAYMAQGRALRASQDLRAALESFRSADAIMHVPTTGIEVARTQVALGWLVEARKTIKQLLAVEAKDEDPAQFISARLAASSLNVELSKRIPKVHISVTGVAPKTMYTVWADGTLVDADDFAHLDFNPGKHTIVARAGAAEAKQFVDIEEGQAKDVVLDLGMDAPEVVAQPRVEAPASGVSPMVYVLGTTAVISFGVAGGSALLERNKEGELSQRCGHRCTEQDLEPAKNLLQISNISLVAGGVTAAAALVWYLVDTPSRPARQLARSPVVPLDVRPTAGGAFMEWTGSF
jgi:hypothetical protein